MSWQQAYDSWMPQTSQNGQMYYVCTWKVWNTQSGQSYYNYCYYSRTPQISN